MAATRSPSKPPSVVKVVLWGILTGLAVWQPIVWWDLLPPPTIGDPMAADDGGDSVAGPSQSGEERPKFPVRLFDDPPLIASKPRSSEAATPKTDVSDTGSKPSTNPGGTAPHGSAIPASQGSPTDAEPLRLEPPSLPAADDGTPRTSVPTEVEPLSGRASLRLQHPQRVAVVNYEAPIVETRVAGDDESGTLQLMHQLNDADEAVAAKAREALVQRGFQETHLQLAKQFTSEDASKRARLAAQLPSVAGIDARLWLTWLLRDEVADVRLAAFSVLATGTDPDSLARTISIGRQDIDSRIRSQADQLDRARRGIR